MDFENFHNVYENQQKCLIYMFWVEQSYEVRKN